MKTKILVPGLRTKKLVIFVFLLSFLFSGVGVVQGFPIFFTAIAQAHPVFLSESKYRIRLILHHPGNHDAHEMVASGTHKHDLLDMVIGISEKDGISHTDHEFEFSSKEDPFSTSNQTGLILDAQDFFVLSHRLNIFSQEKTAQFFGLLPPIRNKSHPSLRSTLLII